MIVNIEVQSVHSLSCQPALNHSSILPKRQSCDNYRGWKTARQPLEQIRSFSVILDDCRFLLYRLKETDLVNNWNHPLPVGTAPRLVSGNKQGPKLPGCHSDSRPNIHVSRRQLVK